MKFPTVILVLLVLSKSVVTTNYDLITATSNLIEHLQLPVQVTVLSCWSESEKLQFWSGLNSFTSVRFFTENQVNLPWNDRNQHQNLLVIDAGCSKSKNLLRSAGQLLYYRVKWIIINNKTSKCEQFLKFFDNLQVLISSEVYYICEENGVQGFAIKQVYRLSLTTELIEETFGFWNKGVIVNSQFSKYSSVRRHNLNHYKLRASIVITHNETVNHLEDYSEKHVDAVTKSNYFLTKHVAQDLNATLKFSYVNQCWETRARE